MYGLYGLFFFNPKIVRIVRICFQIVRIVRIFILENTPFFLIFTHFSKFFMKIQKKNSRQNAVSLTYFLHSK